MNIISDDIIHFFQKQNFTIVSTIDAKGMPHSSCKGIVKINRAGKVYLIDLYKENTYKNLKRNPEISVTAVDEHRFKGYCLKGIAQIIERDKFGSALLKAWEKKISGRITKRILKNISGEIGHLEHPEARFPKPAYLIAVKVKEAVNLTPRHLK